MVEHIAGNISRYNMFPVGARVGVAVSGGADSVCLLHALFELAPRWNLRLSVIHVEHGIRGEASRADAGFVRDLAAGMGLPFLCRSADVPAIADESRDNLEQAARLIRHEFYRELVGGGALDRVATGHTRNDQAETVLYRILRGSGVSGLAGIRAVTSEGLVRPLLSLWRRDVEAWLRERHIAWREDETNAELSYDRNRIRHRLLPLLRAEYNPRIDETLARMATLAADDERYWEEQVGWTPRSARVPPDPLFAGEQASKGVGGGPGGRPTLTFEVGRISAAPPALARRIVRGAIELVKGDLRQIDFAHVEAILELARSTEGSGRLQAPGIDVLRSFDWIRFRPLRKGGEPRRGFSHPIVPPCTIEWPEGGTISFEIGSFEIRTNGCDKLEAGLDWPEILSLPELREGTLELRNWTPGDCYRPAGRSSEQKIKQMFQEARIPLWKRREWPVLVAAGRVLWSRQFGPAAEFAVTGASASRLSICERNVPVA
ncbi:MAG: tRNA lysidine(34) synthetase TilS [Bryobacteraceae bacterium]|jgi:tRNA(Ile)-lysidine synthase